jgi:hypothetical protein
MSVLPAGWLIHVIVVAGGVVLATSVSVVPTQTGLALAVTANIGSGLTVTETVFEYSRQPFGSKAV